MNKRLSCKLLIMFTIIIIVVSLSHALYYGSGGHIGAMVFFAVFTILPGIVLNESIKLYKEL